MTPQEARTYIENIWDSLKCGDRFRCVEDAIRVVLMGADLKIGPSLSLDQMHIINGKVCPGRPLKHGLVLRANVLDTFEAVWLQDPFGWRVTATRGGLTHTETVTWEDAVSSGIIYGKGGAVKDTWQKHAKRMLLWTAIDDLHDVLCGDITGGLVTPDELGVEVEDPEYPPGVIISSSWQDRKKDEGALAEIQSQDPGTQRDELARLWAEAMTFYDSPDQLMHVIEHDAGIPYTEGNIPHIIEFLRHGVTPL